MNLHDHRSECVTRREWQIVDRESGSYVLTIDDFQHDAKHRAVEWIKAQGPDAYELRYATFERWVTHPETDGYDFTPTIGLDEPEPVTA